MADFAGYNLTELRSLVLRLLRASDTTRYSATATASDYDWIDNALNNAQVEFVDLTESVRSDYLLELTASQRTYSLPANFLDVASAYWYEATDDYTNLRIISTAELDMHTTDWRTATGDPEMVYIDGSETMLKKLGVYKIPDASGASSPAVVGNIMLRIYRLSDALSGASDYPEILRQYHRALVYFAAAELLESQQEDSVEYKRSRDLYGRFYGMLKPAKKRISDPAKGRRPRMESHMWSSYSTFNWYDQYK